MGSCSYATIDFSNICDNAIGDTYEIPGLCQEVVFDGNQSNVPYCTQISDEWYFDSLGSTCGLSDCDQNFGGAGDFVCCHSGCCNFVARRAVCQRIAFNGDPTTCCLSDIACDPSDTDLCFSDFPHKNTCNPVNRDMTTSSCQSTMLSYCLGEDLPTNDTSWLNRWDGEVILNGRTFSQPCVYSINRNLYNTPSTPIICNNFDLTGLPISATGFGYAQNLLTQAYNKYKSQGFILGVNPGSAGFSQFQNTLLGLCLQQPGICTGILNNAASGLTTQNLLDLPTAAQIFGCYLPDAEYQTYVDQYQIPKECTPTCNRSNVIPLVAADGITQVKCTNSICLMDNVSVNLINSQVGGNIQFSQICGGCGASGPNVSSSCTCILQDTTLDAINSTIGGSINFEQNCVGAVTCVQTDSSGNKIQVPCGSSTTTSQSPYAQEIALQQQAQSIALKQGNTVIIIAIILFVILIIVILVILKLKK